MIPHEAMAPLAERLARDEPREVRARQARTVGSIPRALSPPPDVWRDAQTLEEVALTRGIKFGVARQEFRCSCSAAGTTCSASITASNSRGRATRWPTWNSKRSAKKLRPLVTVVADAFPKASVEVWATDSPDEHRIGRKPLLRRVWAPIGRRPTAIVQHRFAWRSLVGFVQPASGRTLFHLATSVSIALFAVELAAFAEAVGASPTKQIVLVLDRAGWHTSLRLRVPACVHLLFLPPIPRNSSRPSTSGR